MQKNAYRMMLIFATVLLIIAGCAGRQPQVEAVAANGEKTIDMKADSYKFEPNNIRANRGDTLVLNITNVSNTEHNFTIKDPGGKIMQSVELIPHKTERVKISFPETGTYGFYCNKPFHPTLGMKGSIEVGPAS